MKHVSQQELLRNCDNQNRKESLRGVFYEIQLLLSILFEEIKRQKLFLKCNCYSKKYLADRCSRGIIYHYNKKRNLNRY